MAFADRSIIMAPGPVVILKCGIFMSQDRGNDCSHPAFQKDGSRSGMCAALTLGQGLIYSARTLLHNGLASEKIISLLSTGG